MNRNAFRQLLKRYVAGTANADERELVDHWYELLYNKSVTRLSEAELNSIEQDIWNRLETEARFSQSAIRPVQRSIKSIGFRWAAAAAIAAAIIAGIYSLYPSKQQPLVYQQPGKEQQKLVEIMNATPEIEKVQLEDGTSITLQPSAKLLYPRHFSPDKREVYLEGEAFFSVAKNPAKPFLVHSGNLVTQVLGTSFTIKPDKKTNQITVAVKTGRVAVFEDVKRVPLDNEQQKNNGTIITPNQKVVYDVSSRYFATSLVENPEPVLRDTGNIAATTVFSFDEARLETVLDKVGRLYGIEILVENENIYQCRFTGNITAESLYDKLSAICQATNHQYEIKGTKILIKGKGCN